MFGSVDVEAWELIGLAVNFAVVFVLNHLYKNRVRDADVIKNVPSYEVGAELLSVVREAPEKMLPYVCVSGFTQSVGTPLKSNFNDSVGVVQHHVYVEHRSKRTQGFWTDAKRVIKDQINARPFQLIGEQKTPVLEVTEPLTAELLRETLDVVHDHYQPASDSLLARSLDRLFGEVTKGFQETESMLRVGVNVIGIGKVVFSSNSKLVLGPPDNDHRYILTTLSKPELITSLKSDARMLNILRWVFFVTGSAAFAYIIYRNIVQFNSRRRSQRLLDELRARRQANAAGRDNEQELNAEMTCIVCISRPREVVLLDCGHICLCGECAEALPVPKLCPVCRQSILRIVPTFLP